MGPWQSTRLNVTISGAAPPPRVSTTGTTMAATMVAICGEVHGVTTTARAVPSKAHDTKATTQAMSFQAQREPNALPSRALASHPRAPHTEQPTLVAQPPPMAQPAPAAQLALATQSALVAFQAAQIDPRSVQPSQI
ncbi:hypothetical protein ACFX15_037019 [Malus domestica]